MDDQPSSKKGQESTSETPPQSAPQASVKPIKAPENRQATAQYNTKENPLNDRPKWTDVAIVILTAGIVYFAHVQSKDMKDAGTQTDKIITADERLAKAMENSVKQAGDALNASIEASRTDQRAWIAIGTPSPTLKVGNPSILQVRIWNAGKTPAFITKGSSVIEPLPNGAYPDFKPRRGEITSDPIVLSPNAQFFVTHQLDRRNPAQNMDETMLRPLTNSTVIVYLWGRIEYEDVFR